LVTLIAPVFHQASWCAMRVLSRSVFTGAILLIAPGLLTQAFHLMNQPSDRLLTGGIAMVLGLAIAVPMVIHRIWSKLKGRF